MAPDFKEVSVSNQRVALVVSSLSAGGAERVISTMANYWAKKNWEITFITLDSYKTDFYPLDSRVERKALNLVNDSHNLFMALLSNFRRIRTIRKALKETTPDTVISFVDTTNVLTLLSCIGLKINRTIVSERVDPSVHPLPSTWRFLRRISYPLADRVVVQTDSIQKWARKFLPEKKIAIIANPVCSSNDVQCHSDNDLSPLFGKRDSKFLVGMGRLTHQKGFDILIRAFANISERHPEWKLVIFGEGTERAALHQLISSTGMSERVFLPGTTATPGYFLKQADLFVLPSRYEGFPNTLLEAMMAGLPVISFDCPSGPAEIIRTGVDGVLVPAGDSHALTSEIEKLMESKDKRERLAARAPEVIERFGLEQIMTLWEKLITNEI